MDLYKLFHFDAHGDERGSLIALEQNNHIPFTIKRVYYIFDTKQQVARGFHAHHRLEQIAVCVKGSCRFIIDDGHQRKSIILNSPSKALYINNNKWREMHDFSEDCVLLVLASELYDEADYVRDYDEFLALCSVAKQ